MHVDNLKDKIVLVTGASRGIGKAISIAIAQSGAEVILVARDEEKLKQVKEEINHFKGKAVVIKADFSKENEVIQLFEQIKKNINVWMCLSIMPVLLRSVTPKIFQLKNSIR